MKSRLKGRASMTQPTPPTETNPPPDSREDAAKAVDRVMIVAEAKFLVKKLDDYLELIGRWEEEAEHAQQ